MAKSTCAESALRFGGEEGEVSGRAMHNSGLLVTCHARRSFSATAYTPREMVVELHAWRPFNAAANVSYM
jgi:hypothetical protein